MPPSKSKAGEVNAAGSRVYDLPPSIANSSKSLCRDTRRPHAFQPESRLPAGALRLRDMPLSPERFKAALGTI
jgi:hypothetical protein